MDVERHRVRAAWAAPREEIERPIDNVRRTNWDKWMRKEWHRAGARNRWSAGRKAKWVEWRDKRSRTTVPDGPDRSARSGFASPKVWAKGHVPPEFLDWVDRHWSHDDQTRVMLNAGVGRRYKDRDGNWQSSQSSGRNEIPLAVWCLEKAFEKIIEEEQVQSSNGVQEEVVE